MADSFIDIKGIERLSKKLEGVDWLLDNGEQAFGEIGLFLTAMIEARTMTGKDVDGDLFEPYSPRYAKFRAKAGHSVDKVNLFFTGLMFNALTHEASMDRVRIYFMPTTDKHNVSSPAKAYFLNEDRHFFGMSDKDKKTIVEIYAKYVKEAFSG